MVEIGKVERFGEGQQFTRFPPYAKWLMEVSTAKGKKMESWEVRLTVEEVPVMGRAEEVGLPD